MEKGEDLTDELKDKFDGLLDNINEQYETVKLKAESIMKSDKKKLDDLENKVKDAIA